METTTLIQQLYIAYYGRPADPNGLDYWVGRLESNGGDLNTVISAFATSSEFETRFGGLDEQALINNLYQQLFGRPADDAGLAFYTDMLARGDSSLIELALDIANGAREDDSVVIGKRTEIAQQFTQEVAERGVAYGAIDAAAQLLKQVTATTNVTTYLQNDAKALVDQWAGNDNAPSTPPTKLFTFDVMEAIEKLQSDGALPARFNIVDSAENLGAAIFATFEGEQSISVENNSEPLAPAYTPEELQAVLKGAISIGLTDDTLDFMGLTMLMYYTALVIAYGEEGDIESNEQFMEIAAKFDLMGAIITSVVDSFVTLSEQDSFSYLDFIDLVNAGGYSVIDTLANIMGENANGSAVLAGANTIIATDINEGTPLTLETVTEIAAGTTLKLGGDVAGAYSLTQAQLEAIESSDVIDLFDGDLITVTGISVMEGRFDAADAIAMLDDNDTIVLQDQSFLNLTAAEFEDFAPALTVAGDDFASLLITDIANSAELTATSLTDTFVVAGLGNGESAMLSGLQTGDKIAVGSLIGLTAGMVIAGDNELNWNFASDTLIYEISDDGLSTNETVELTLTGIGYLQYANGVFTVDNNIV